MKLLTLLFLTLSIPVCAQFHNVKGVRIVERTEAGDSTTISGVGQIQYDGDDDKIRFNDGNGWYSFLRDDATLPYWPLTGSATATGNISIIGDQKVLTLGHAITGSSKFSAFSFFSGNGSDITHRFQMNSTSISSQYLNTTADKSHLWSMGAAGYQMTTDSVDVSSQLFIFSDKLNFLVEGSGIFSFGDDGNDFFGVVSFGEGIQIDDGANETMGIATLSAGTVTVNNTKVTANSRIFLTVNGGTLTNVGTPYVSARVASTSFTITSTNASDASDVAWIIIEPAP